MLTTGDILLISPVVTIIPYLHDFPKYIPPERQRSDCDYGVDHQHPRLAVKPHFPAFAIRSHIASLVVEPKLCIHAKIPAPFLLEFRRDFLRGKFAPPQKCRVFIFISGKPAPVHPRLYDLPLNRGEAFDAPDVVVMQPFNHILLHCSGVRTGAPFEKLKRVCNAGLLPAPPNFCPG